MKMQMMIESWKYARRKSNENVKNMQSHLRWKSVGSENLGVKYFKINLCVRWKSWKTKPNVDEKLDMHNRLSVMN